MVWVLTGLSRFTLAQSNYVANTVNSPTPGMLNTLVGPGAGFNLTTGYSNAIVGASAGSSTTSGYSNAFMGYFAGFLNTTGFNNVFIGRSAGYLNTAGQSNTFLGHSAGYTNGTGNYNAFVGDHAGYSNISGTSNAFVGIYAGYANTTGGFNTLSGANSGESTTTGSMNSFLGFQSGNHNTTGSENSFVGTNAGWANTTGTGNTLVGSNANVGSGSLTNATAIGYQARVAISNAVVLGDPTNTSVHVGIGTDSPQFSLDVKGIINIRGAGGTLKFSHLLNPNLQNGSTDQFLTVNERGETVLARYRLAITRPEDWADKVFKVGYPLQPLPDVERFIKTYQHLPGIPSAADVTQNGIDATILNAKLLEKIEELTLYLIEVTKKTTEQQKRIEQLEKQVLELKDH